jgi:hypothetical protein
LGGGFFVSDEDSRGSREPSAKTPGNASGRRGDSAAGLFWERPLFTEQRFREAALADY